MSSLPGDPEKCTGEYDSFNTKKKYIYLTFDCGYENGHTKKILNILKEKNIKAIFFVTKPYIEGNAKLVKRMKKEGHLVGNHTSTHPRLGECNTDNTAKFCSSKSGQCSDRCEFHTH